MSDTKLDDVERSARRESLKKTIMRIESEFRDGANDVSANTASAAPRAIKPDPSPELDAPEPRLKTPRAGAVNGERREPEIGSLDVAPSRQRGDDRAPLKPVKQAKPGKARKEKKKGGFRRFLLTAGCLAALAGFGYLWISSSDMQNASANRSRPQLGAGGATGAPLKEGETAADIDWITVFDPSNPTQLSVSGRATAEVVTKDGRQIVRLKSPDENDYITFDIGQGIVEQLSGKLAVFDIIAESDNGDVTQMAVSCDFDGLADCGRMRYDVTDEQNEYLFEVQFASGARAKSGGKITLNTDISGNGKTIDLHAIRVSVAP
ncbi:MAG: hypothetical protein ACRECW_15630 [Phyllobacterium sp.]